MSGRRWLWAALAATLAGSGWLALQDDPDAAVELARDADAAPAASPSPSPIPSPRTADRAPRPREAWPAPPLPRASEAWPFDAATAQAWLPPPPPPPPPAPPAPRQVPAQAPAEPAPPQAPPFPYTLIGRVEDAGQAHALLSGPAQTLGVKAQDVIDGQWRVDGVDERGLSLTWLPGGQRTTILFRTS